MVSFIEQQRSLQAGLKGNRELFSENASPNGVFKKTSYPFCLPLEAAEENIFSYIREDVFDFFNDSGIKWHMGGKRRPNNHLCSSQVCCVNFLFPLSQEPNELTTIFKPVFSDIKEFLPIENGYFVSFEWIGEMDYLGEKKNNNTKRTRGALYTSADSIIRYVNTSGKIHVVLIEWKYTETYSSHSYLIADSGKDRREIYQHLFDREDFPLNKTMLPEVSDLFFEPFYQFMRQQLLANEMEKAREMDADIVSVLHISPKANSGFKRITSMGLVGFGNSATEVWRNLLLKKDRFNSVSTETLFSPILMTPSKPLELWARYIRSRYPWVLEV